MKKYTLINHETGEQKHYTKAEWKGRYVLNFVLGIVVGMIITRTILAII